MGSTEVFEIEEEFDLSLLGLSNEPQLPPAAGLIGSPCLESKKVRGSLSIHPGTPRPRYGRYVSADWTPELDSTSSFASSTATPTAAHLKDQATSENTALPKVESHDYADSLNEEARPSSPTLSNAATTTTNEGYTTVELTDADIPPAASHKERTPRHMVYLKRRRMPSGRIRPSIRMRLPSPQKESSTGSSPVSPPPPPLPISTLQRDVISTFTKSTLESLESLSKQHNSTGLHLPTQLRDFFPALISNKSAIHLANELRHHLHLPSLSVHTDRVALRRSIAIMRERLYLEIAAALILPLAPLPTLANGDTHQETKSEEPDLSLTPSSLAMMSKTLPKAFPHDAASIKAFLKPPRGAHGDEKAKVVWERGVGRLLGAGQAHLHSELESGFGIHVFVDHSNILHGLLQHLYASNSTALPPRHLRTLSLPCLSLLLRRGRATPPGTLHLVASSPLHQDLDPLVRLGWDVSILKRVEVYEDNTPDPAALQLQSKANGHAMERHDTGIRRYREQAVDEILCLKVLQTLNKRGVVAPPGSKIVLATGDARGGQFNEDGFLGTVKEALKRGWHVELWSWSSGLSRAWAETAKREGWGKEFHIHYLDPWALQLVEVLPDDEDD